MPLNLCAEQKQAGLESKQIEGLITLRENYMGRTRKILQQRQALWQNVRVNLLDASLLDGLPSAERRICSFEKMLELRRSMDDYHWNFAWMMREWLLRLLTPFQVHRLVPHRDHSGITGWHCSMQHVSEAHLRIIQHMYQSICYMQPCHHVHLMQMTVCQACLGVQQLVEPREQRSCMIKLYLCELPGNGMSIAHWWTVSIDLGTHCSCAGFRHKVHKSFAERSCPLSFVNF